MKKVLLALALVSGAASANAATLAAPLFGCMLNAGNFVQIAGDIPVLNLIIRGETLQGQGTVVCRDAVGQRYAQNVIVNLSSGGFGPAINGPLQGMTLFAVRAGLVTTDGMAGAYNFSVGPRLGLIAARVGVMGGVQVSGQGASVGVEAVIENRFSIGLDLGAMAMEVVPATRLHRIR